MNGMRAFYIPDTSDTTHALQVVHNFIERQGTELVGGLVMRKFIELKSLGEHPKSHTPIFEEYRVFYLNNSPLGSLTIGEQKAHFISSRSKTHSSSPKANSV